MSDSATPWTAAHQASLSITNYQILPKLMSIVSVMPSNHLVKAMVFPVVMYGCESWTTKKAEHWRTDAFELWCWRRLLRVPWTARRSNKSILKEISPGSSLESLRLKLKLQYFAHLMRRFFQNLPQFVVIHTVKGFDIVNKTEVDVFLELSCFFHDPTDTGNLISVFSAFSKAWKSGSSQFMYC